MWSEGDRIQLRYVHEGRLSRIHPVTVVEDAPDSIALYLAAGTPLRVRVQLDGSPIERTLSYRERFALPWRLGEGLWHGHSVLQLARPGDAHSVWAVWDERHAFEGWYVNLQAPLRRIGVGFETADHVLDIVVDRDLAWRWKDEDEFAQAVEVGRFTPAEADEIRAEGERAIAAIEARTWPYDAGWDEWRPDPRWPIPERADP